MPASFVSSRTNRATKLERSIDDYLDDEDKNTMIGGVNASASLVANKMYDTNNIAERDKQKSLSKGTDRSIIPGPAIDEFFFIPNKSIGLKLLKSLGWKETRDDFSKHKYNHPHIKDNLYGLGYNYDTANASFLKHKLLSKNNEKKVKYSRQTHVTYDHDDYSDTDVFEDTINRQYDHTLNDSGSDAELEVNGDLVTPWLHNQVTQYCPTDGKEVLKNFVLATDGLKRLQITEYPLIQAPKSYDPKHYFSKDKKPASRWGDTELAPSDGRTTSRFAVSKVLGDMPKFDTSQISIPRSNSETPATIAKAADSVKPVSRWADTELVPGATASKVLDDVPKFDANQIVIPHTNSVAVASEIKGAENTERPMLISEKTQSRFAGLATLVKNKFAPSSQGATDSASSITNKKLPSRVTSIWYPEALLCKRFNVPRPALANTSVVGGVAKAAAVAPNEILNDDTTVVTVNTTISEVESTIFYPLQQERPAASLFESIFCDFDNIINKVEKRLAPKVASHMDQKPALSFEFEDDVEKDAPKTLPTVDTPTVGTKAAIFRRVKRDRSVSPESNTISAPITVAPPPKASSSSSSSDSSSDSSRSRKKSHRKKKKRHKNKKGHRDRR